LRRVGSRDAQLATLAKARELKRTTALYDKALDEAKAIAVKHGGQGLFLPREKRRAFGANSAFTTEQYAEKFNISVADAYVELARSHPHFSVWMDRHAGFSQRLAVLLKLRRHLLQIRIPP
jgi:hypothetical protein